MTDTCPNCVRRHVEPTAEERTSTTITHTYTCPDCGHIWDTSRYLPAYPHLRRAA